MDTHGSLIEAPKDLIGVVVGDVGSGKTTLFNKICGTNRNNGFCKDSNTR
jgi:ABC-type cobalamin/Fe3+-siderophores transport system ATPase subunit